MKERSYQYNAINSDFRTALFLWQGNPESSVAVSRMDNLLKRAGEMGVNLTFKIKKDILQNSEARRAISEQDLRRYAKIEGDLLGGEPDRGIIDKYNFIFKAKSEYGWRTVGVFRAHEIDSFVVG